MLTRRRASRPNSPPGEKLADAPAAHSELTVDSKEVIAKGASDNRDLLPRPRRIEADTAVARFPDCIVVGDDNPVIAVVEGLYRSDRRIELLLGFVGGRIAREERDLGQAE